jgi:glycosyltransferase involved in cell wall biosynthesis
LLARCVRSVADQPAPGVSVFHHIQDGGSADGTATLLEQVKSEREGYRLTFTIAPDEGMYDALNRGVEALRASSASPDEETIISWLNCDEQYLPGTLPLVADYFRAHPEVDILFGGTVLIDESGRFLACRKALPMRRHFLESSYLYNFSCATFFRASCWQKLGGFNLDYKNAGDEELMLRAMRSGVRTAVLNRFLSAFTWGGSNLSSSMSALEEHRRLKRGSNRWLRAGFNILRLAEKGLSGGFFQRGPLTYEIYLQPDGGRVRFEVRHPTCRWPGTSGPYLLRHRLERRHAPHQGGEG